MVVKQLYATTGIGEGEGVQWKGSMRCEGGGRRTRRKRRESESKRVKEA